MTRQDHWNRVGEGEGEWVWELCDMVSVNIIINILGHINVQRNVHDTQYKYSISLYLHFSKCIINYNIRLNLTITSAMSQCIHAALAMD